MLTREKVLSMEPGRELDALVAEKVMGWTYGHPCTEGMDCLHWADEKGNVRDYKPPQYSSDITETWKVLEKFEGYKIWKSPFSDSFYEVILLTKSSSYIARGTSFPEVVCKASLLTVIGNDR